MMRFETAIRLTRRGVRRECRAAIAAGALVTVGGCSMIHHAPSTLVPMAARQLTTGAYGHVLTNANVWSPDGQWIVYDVRSDAAGEQFDGDRIERVNVRTGEVQVLYRAPDEAKVGVVTYSPTKDQIVFIQGPRHPTPDWSYGPSHRQGIVVDAARPGVAVNLDARDLTPPLTPGALRGGSHVHMFSPDGQWVSFTYEDALLPPADAKDIPADSDVNARNIGVSVPAGPVRVAADNPNNHDGEAFTVLVTRTVRDPRPGSDDISRAFEESWVGTNGYVRPDGTRQRRALAFQGNIRTADGRTISEVFLADLPDDLTRPGDGPLAGTATRLPSPPAGVTQRRLTFTAGRKYPGIQGPRHWLKSSPDGSRIAFLMRDDRGVLQLWSISPNGDPARQITNGDSGISSAFGWNPNGRSIAYVSDGSLFVVGVATGYARRVTPKEIRANEPSALSCCFSPDGQTIAIIRPVGVGTGRHNQIWVVPVGES